jgi:formylglycine-generating enzyme required for sulfatase activity
MRSYPEIEKYLSGLCSIPEGKFAMGSNSGDVDERPVNLVRVATFDLGTTPVTVAMWREYCKASRLNLPPKPRWGFVDDHPIVNVSWDDIMGPEGDGGFCEWASNVTGTLWTLPTEAQWEYGARGGLNGKVYPWGNIPSSKQVHWMQTSRTKVFKTMSVCRTTQIQRGGYGLTDMVGNVYQWCLNLYGPYSNQNHKSSGIDANHDHRRCVRGASGKYYKGAYRCAERSSEVPDSRFDDLGFRCVVTSRNRK